MTHVSCLLGGKVARANVILSLKVKVKVPFLSETDVNHSESAARPAPNPASIFLKRAFFHNALTFGWPSFGGSLCNESPLKHLGDDQKSAADCDDIFRHRHANVRKPRRFHQAMANLVTCKRTGNTAEDTQDR